MSKDCGQALGSPWKLIICSGRREAIAATTWRYSPVLEVWGSELKKLEVAYQPLGVEGGEG